jgi:hypothetical protein
VDIKKELTPEPMALKDKLKALKAGAFTVNMQFSGYYLHDAIIFDAEEKLDKAAVEKAQAKLAAQFEQLEDEIVLGEGSEALKLLRAFEAGN